MGCGRTQRFCSKKGTAGRAAGAVVSPLLNGKLRVKRSVYLRAAAVAATTFTATEAAEAEKLPPA
jgi:hypothetical protein